MPKFGVIVISHDEGRFVIEANTRKEAEAKLQSMERDEVAEHCSWDKGGYSTEVEGPVSDNEIADVKANLKDPCEECGEAEATSSGRRGNVCDACLELRIELENEAG